VVLLSALASMPFSAGLSQSSAPGGMSGDPQPRDISTWPPINPLANRTADANRILEDEMKLRDNQKRWEKLNVQRRKEMTSDTEKLLALANQLKSETDTVSKASLSVNTIHQAEEIEKLAHSVRDKMRSSVSN
jgi:cell envelope opacity-associated protein A